MARQHKERIERSFVLSMQREARDSHDGRRVRGNYLSQAVWQPQASDHFSFIVGWPESSGCHFRNLPLADFPLV